MSRFIAATIVAITIATAGQLSLGMRTGTWVVVGVWIVYLPLCLLGLASIRMQFFCKSVCRGVPGRMQIALTFDDGPDPGATPRLLELLSQENIPAAFFCIGKNVDAHPQLAARIKEDGHLLGNHTYRHPWWIALLTTSGLTDEMARTQQAIQRAAGVTPLYMRSPMGLTNPHFSRALRKVGLRLVGWDVRPFDTRGDAHNAINRIIRQARDGSIIVLHDGGASPERLVQIVRSAIVELRSRGFSFERLDRLIDQTAVVSAEK
jgi:peptidoglycan/xylan/chitin deacetylase (PgdA/CDA1 family)